MQSVAPKILLFERSLIILYFLLNFVGMHECICFYFKVAGIQNVENLFQ
jgi:hypothetical protein